MHDEKLDLRSLVLTFCVMAAAACDLESKSVTATASDDGGDGDDSAEDPGETGHGDDAPVTEAPCIENWTQILDLDEPTPLGFAASELEGLSDGWTRTFGWLPSRPSLQVEPAGTESLLDIGLSHHRDGIAYYVVGQDNPDYPWDWAGGCEDERVEMQFEIIFKTYDGRFDEVFTVMASARTPDHLEFRQRFEPEEFTGTFSSAQTSFTDGVDGVVKAFELSGSFTEAEGPTGALWAEVHLDPDDPSGGVLGVHVIASWPAGSHD